MKLLIEYLWDFECWLDKTSYLKLLIVLCKMRFVNKKYFLHFH